jgi:hypothetical protein
VLRDLEHEAAAVVLGLQAFRISGRWPSNCTSTTAPMICVTCPVGVVAS